MADSIIYQAGEIDDSILIGAIAGHPNIADYRIGLDITTVTPSEGANGTIDVASGIAYKLLTEHFAPGADTALQFCLIRLQLDPRDTVSLATTGVNEIWAYGNLRSGGEDGGIVATDRDNPTDTPPTTTDAYGYEYDSFLKIAEVRPTQQQSDDPPQVVPWNPYPDARFENLHTYSFRVDGPVTWQDGTITEGPPISIGSPLDNYNKYYHFNTENPPPDDHQIHWAYHADEADHALRADQATRADRATEADEADEADEATYIIHEGDRYDLTDITDLVSQGYTPYGKKLAYYEHTNTTSRFFFPHVLNDEWDEVRVLMWAANQGDDFEGDSLALQINGSYGPAERYRNAHFDFDYFGNPEEEDEQDSVRRPEFSVYYNRAKWWRVCQTPGQETAFGDYSIFAPGKGPNASKEYPLLTRNRHAVGPDVENSMLHGHLQQAGHTTLDTLRVLEPFGNDMTGKVMIFGNNTFDRTGFPIVEVD